MVAGVDELGVGGDDGAVDAVLSDVGVAQFPPAGARAAVLFGDAPIGVASLHDVDRRRRRRCHRWPAVGSDDASVTTADGAASASSWTVWAGGVGVQRGRTAG